MRLLVVLLVLLFGCSQQERKSPQIIRIEFQPIDAALDLFRIDVGRYPTTAEGFEALLHDSGTEGWDGPYIERPIWSDYGLRYRTSPQVDWEILSESGLVIADRKKPTYTVRVKGTSGLMFEGSCRAESPGVSSKGGFTGKIPAEYSFSGSRISCSLQKRQEAGRLTVEILKGGRRMTSGTTSAAYGLAAVATSE